jgi:outer membrane receptor protein involved in Fe transport
MSINFKLLISKVLHTNFGVDVRYSTAYYAEAYSPATAQYYWQNQQKIGNFPIVDLHANLKLKRTRAFFQLQNAATGFLDVQYWAAPNYPLYRRTFRLGIAWSFYD